jgi:uncharacterized protein YbjT (DUF2867 family)
VRIGSRRADPAFDWEAPETWAAALDGVRAAYISYAPDIAAVGAAETVAAFARQAAGAGVERLVLLSGRGEAGAERAEQFVRDSGAACTILRASWFDQNFSESYLLEPVLLGEVALPVGDMLEPFVDADDIADVAVAALTEPGHAGELYELTGPRLLTFADAVAAIGRASGRDLTFVSVSMDDYVATMVEQQVPDEYVQLLTYLFTEVLDGRNAHLADGVRRALGREPRDFTEFARDAAAAGAWASDDAEVVR